MEEEILIQSKVDKKAKGIFFGILIVLLLGTLLFLFLAIGIGETERLDDMRRDWSQSSRYQSFEEFVESKSSWDYRGILDYAFELFVTHWILLGLTGIFAIVFWAHSKCELNVTNKNVKGKTFFGKEVVLPIHMISAYSTRRFLAMVTVATASGFTKFSLIGNYKEIGNVLQNLINERQLNTQISVGSIATENTDKFNYLKQLKELLDNDAVSQEEFEAKKKEILGI